MNRILVAGMLLVLVIAVGWLSFMLGGVVTKKEMLAKQVKMVEQARIEEQELQETANREREQQAKDLGAIAANLALDVERLRRERPTRPSVPKDTGNDGSCGTGPTLCTDDKILLRTEFARADEIRIGLIRCYADYDSLRKVSIR